MKKIDKEIKVFAGHVGSPVQGAASASDQGAAVKRWPFVETPGEFAERLAAATMAFGGDMLAAVRNVLIENPPALAERAQAQPSGAVREVIGYVNLETLSFAVGFYQNKIPEGYHAVKLATPAPEQEAAPEETEAEMKRLHDALCFWLPQSHGGLPDAMQERIAADAYLLVGYDDMPDKQSAEELGWISAGIKAAQGVEADDSDLYKKISSVLLENTKMRGHTIGMVANQLLPLFRAAFDSSTGSATGPVGYVNLETLDFAVGFLNNKVPEGYRAVNLAAPVPATTPAEQPQGLTDDQMWKAAVSEVGTEHSSVYGNRIVLSRPEDVGDLFRAIIAEQAKGSLDVDSGHCMCPACKDGTIHDSCCAVHNMPADPNGPCDCSVKSSEECSHKNEYYGPGAARCSECGMISRSCATATNTNQPEGEKGGAA